MRLSVVTPSYRSSAWLKLCIASVADQGADVEHIVQDAGSDDGTLDWLPSDKRVRAFVEKDAGMYDAINRGLQRAKGEILGYLNCDEQYLPGSVRLVTAFFEDNPDVDVVFGDVVIVNVRGEYLWHRKMQTPLKYHTWTCHLSTLSCGMFFRRRVFFDLGFHFLARWRDAGDGEWMVRLLRAGLKMKALGQFTSAFVMTGTNMSQGENARNENRALRQTAPVPVQLARPLFVLQHRARRWLGGMYSQAPFEYEIYTLTSPNKRQRFAVAEPVSRAS